MVKMLVGKCRLVVALWCCGAPVLVANFFSPYLLQAAAHQRSANIERKSERHGHKYTSTGMDAVLGHSTVRCRWWVGVNFVLCHYACGCN